MGGRLEYYNIQSGQVLVDNLAANYARQSMGQGRPDPVWRGNPASAGSRLRRPKTSKARTCLSGSAPITVSGGKLPLTAVTSTACTAGPVREFL